MVSNVFGVSKLIWSGINFNSNGPWNIKDMYYSPEKPLKTI